MALTREQILAQKTAGHTETYKLADGSGEVIIRGLTRKQVLSFRGRGAGDDPDELAEMDNELISLGLVDPAMTPEDVAEWAENGQAGTLILLSRRISELSGIEQGAGKSGVPRTGKRSRS